MKAILLLVLLASAMTAETFLSTEEQIKDLELTQSKFMDFLMGYALGIGLMNAVPSVLGCVTTVTGFQSKIQEAIADLQTKDLEHIVSGVQILASVFDNVAGNCGNTVIEGVTSYKELMAKVTSKGFIKEGWINIGKNLEVVIHDIQEFFFLDDDWMMKGAYLGDIVKIYVTGEPNDQMELE